MKPLIAACICLLIAHGTLGPALAAEGDPATALLKERLEVRAKADKLTQEGSQATAALQTRKNLMFGILMSAKGPKPSAAQLEQWKSSAETLRLQLAAVQRQLELAEITDPAIRAEKIKQLEAASAKIDKQLQEAGAPLQKKLDALNAPLQKTDADFAAALEKFFKDGSGAFTGAKHDKVTWMTNGTGQVHWHGPGQKQLAWGSIFLQDRDTGNFSVAKIDDAYSVVSVSSQSNFKCIWISLGYFKLCINVNKPEWGNDQAALIDVAKNLIDLKGLNSLRPEK